MVILVWLFLLPCLPLSLFIGFVFFFGGGKERGLFSLVKSLQMSESCLAFLKIVKMKKTNIFKHFFQFML